MMKFFLTLTIITSILTLASSQPAISRPGCPSTCANLTIPFPFGTSSDCYLDESFFINCTTLQGTVTPFLRRGDIQVLDISLNGEIKISAFTASDCYDPQTNTRLPNYPVSSTLTVSRFPVSSTRNKLTVVGCDTLALVTGSLGRNYTNGCISSCDRVDSVVNGSCSGIGCCQTSIPAGVRNYAIRIQSMNNYSGVGDFNPCGYAFVVEEGAYEFSSLDLRNMSGRSRFPVVLDWSVGNVTCEEARKNQSSYGCRATNSECVDSVNGDGYRCNCPSGFEGNPYLADGCQDVDECSVSDPCSSDSECNNLPGTFSCHCPIGYLGDGRKIGTGCSPPPTKSRANGSTLLHVALGTCIGLLVLIVASSWTYWIMRKRKIMRLREKFFQQNGGFMLKQQLSGHDGAAQRARIFTAEDLKRATNNYEDRRIIGQGGFGTVYKGLIQPDNREVAIKKSKISDQSQIEQFINEVVVLSQINHRNIVKLLGCCLETEVPLLVYEFISNGTLSDHLHEKGIESKPLSWEMRLKIAAETAEAIAYLHSATSMPIIHRDIKSTNILLDENYTTKVSDFGASKLVPLDHTQLTTMVQGTFGYLDPEYFHSSQLTEKSDVYSFGVLLAELLTGEKALSFERAEKDRNLAMYFVNGVNGDCLLEIIDNVLVKEGDYEQIKEVGVLAKGCLSVKGEKRPSMKEIARELERLRTMGNKHPWVNIDLKLEETETETEHLLDQVVPSDGFIGVVTGLGTSVEYDTMRNQVPLALHDGR